MSHFLKAKLYSVNWYEEKDKLFITIKISEEKIIAEIYVCNNCVNKESWSEVFFCITTVIA